MTWPCPAMSGHPDFDRELDEAVSNWVGQIDPTTYKVDPFGRRRFHEQGSSSSVGPRGPDDVHGNPDPAGDEPGDPGV